MMNKTVHKLISLMLMCVLLTGCTSSKKKDKREDFAYCEHIVTLESVSAEDPSVSELRDEEGFLHVNDIVYVNTDTINIREAANAESELVDVAEFGTQLNRTGIGQDGWDRISYEDGSCYVSHELVTVVPISANKSFEYSAAVLTVVDSKHKQYSYDDMILDLKELHETYPDKMKLNIIGTSVDNRNIFEVVIGSEKAKKDIYLVSGLCGAEYMSSLVLMKQIEYYLHYYEAGYYEGYAFSDLFDNVRVHIVPMLNPDSVEISQHYLAGMHSEKIVMHLKEWFDRDQMNGGINSNLDNYLMFFFANAQGVDLRKNFPYQWDAAGSTLQPGANGYRGNSAGSEAETKAIMHALSEVKPDLLVVYHTTGSRIYYNYGQSDEILAKTRSYGSYLSRMMTYELNDKKLTEDACGSLAGYSNNILQIPSLTVHLGNGSAPLSPNEFNAIWNACRDSWAALQVNMIEW